MIEDRKIGDITYLDASCIASGDYGGAGSVGVANQRYIDEKIEAGELTSESFYFSNTEELQRDGFITTLTGRDSRGFSTWEAQPFTGADVLIFGGGHGGRTMWIRSDIDFAEEVNALADYPCFDDELVSFVEQEWEAEAWHSYVMQDLTADMPEHLEDKAGRLEDDLELFTLYKNAMEDTNTYPTPEYAGVHVDVDRIKETFTALVAAA